MDNLEKLYKLLIDDGLDIDAIELAESLWLSQYISKIEKDIEADDITISDETKEEDTSTLIDKKEVFEDVKEISHNTRQDIPLYPTSSKNSLPFRTPLVRNLHKDNNLIYAFRHFRHKITSLEEFKLDEEKIADYMITADIFKPIYKKNYEKKFSILFIVDSSKSMEIWNSLIENFIMSVKNYHIFKKVTIYYISTDNDIPELFKKKERLSKVNTKWYKNIESNTLIFMFSDMISKSWSTGQLLNEITIWQQYFHFAIIQMLPQRSWNDTMLYRTFSYH